MKWLIGLRPPKLAPSGRLLVDYGQWEHRQIQQGSELMGRYKTYAASIGCTTYEGALSDSIEVHTEDQLRLLTEWWEANTKGMRT